MGTLVEFKQGLENLENKSYSKAIDSFLETIKILNSSKSSETVGYLITLNKLSKAFLHNNDFKKCYETLQKALDLSYLLFSTRSEMIFQQKKNLLNFLMFTDPTSANDLLNVFLKDKNAPYYRYLIFQGITIKIVCEKYKEAYDLIDLSYNIDINPSFEGHIKNNLAVLKQKIIEDTEKKGKEFFNLNSYCFKNKDFSKFNQNDEIISLVNDYKLALKYYMDLNKTNNNEDQILQVKLFLDSNLISPTLNKIDKLNEDDYLKVIKEIPDSTQTRTITNLTELLFLQGDKYLKDTGFWFKAGLNINDTKFMPRHLIIGGLIYSQMGQSLIAEGMYRQALELLKNEESLENKANLSFCLNMYGKLLLRTDKRKSEGEKLIDSSKNVIYYDSYKTLVRLHFLDFDFN